MSAPALDLPVDPVEEVPADAGAEVTTEAPTPPIAAEPTAPIATQRPQTIPPHAELPVPPDQNEIQRRREIVRALFNDFWSGSEEKPPRFVDRLDQAVPYLNERLRALGEPWQLDADCRRLLGLPPSAC